MGQIGENTNASNQRAQKENDYDNDENDTEYADVDDFDEANNSAYSGSGLKLLSETGKSAAARQEPFKYKPKTEIGQDVAPKPELFVDYEGYRFPVRLDNPWAVAKVLNQSKGRLTMKELKSSTKTNSIKISAQAKVS